MWSPLEHRPSTTALSAPMPEAKARAVSAPSISAMACSKPFTVGLPYRLYRRTGPMLVASRRLSSTVGVTNAEVAHRIGASAVSLSARPARMAVVSGRSGGVGSGASSGIGFLHLVEERGQRGGDLVGGQQEPVVAVGTVDLNIAGLASVGAHAFDDVTLLVRRVQAIGIDAHGQHLGLHPTEGPVHPAPAPAEV